MSTRWSRPAGSTGCLPTFGGRLRYGYRTSNGRGQHEALGLYLRAILATPPGDNAARQFDRMRRSRNQSHYEAAPIGKATAAQAESIARDLYAAAIARGVG